MTHTTADVLIVDDGGLRVAAVQGVLDVFSSSGLSARVLAQLPRGVRAVVVDLEGTDAIDTGGISALVRLGERARARSLDLRLRFGAGSRLSPTVSAILRRTFDTVDDPSAVESRTTVPG